MTPLYRIILSAVVIFLMLTAGCFNTSGPSPLVTPQVSQVSPPIETTAVPATTNLPVATGTGAAGACTANIQSDAANCGGCGYACPANALCQQGQCFCKDGFVVENNACVVAPSSTNTDSGCPAGMSPCPDGYCYELASSSANCGMCGNVCPTGMVCSASTCTNVPTETTTAVAATTTAPVTTVVSSGPTLVGPVKSCIIIGMTNCGGSCVDTSTDGSNCGSCGTKCIGPLMGCCNSACTSYASDASNCGSCGHKCSVYSICKAGSCTVKTVVTGIGLVTLAPQLTVTIPKYQVNPVIGIPGY